MIRIAKGSRLLLFQNRTLPEERWEEKVAAAGASPEALIVETLGAWNVPICPTCLGPIEHELPPAGAGLVVCPECVHPLVVLRFLREGRAVWHSFPWPE
jgi:hypothetical protein